MEQVKKLREVTGAGVMDCKKALEAFSGDFEKAVEFLKQKGIQSASKREGREAKDGLISIQTAGSKGAIIELNCETDFVARTDDFMKLAEQIAKKVLQQGESVVESEEVTKQVMELSGKTGEKTVLRRGAFLEAKAGFVAQYLHSNKKIGVIVAVESKSADTAQQVGKDIAMQVAAARPQFVQRQDIPAEVIERQKEYFKSEVADKPPHIQEKILNGKVEKWYEEACLLEQGFIRNNEQKVRDYLAEIQKSTGEPVTIRRFIRFELGG